MRVFQIRQPRPGLPKGPFVKCAEEHWTCRNNADRVKLTVSNKQSYMSSLYFHDSKYSGAPTRRLWVLRDYGILFYLNLRSCSTPICINVLASYRSIQAMECTTHNSILSWGISSENDIFCDRVRDLQPAARSVPKIGVQKLHRIEIRLFNIETRKISLRARAADAIMSS